MSGSSTTNATSPQFQQAMSAINSGQLPTLNNPNAQDPAVTQPKEVPGYLMSSPSMEIPAFQGSMKDMITAQMKAGGFGTPDMSMYGVSKMGNQPIGRPGPAGDGIDHQALEQARLAKEAIASLMSSVRGFGASDNNSYMTPAAAAYNQRIGNSVQRVGNTYVINGKVFKAETGQQNIDRQVNAANGGTGR